MGRKYRPSRQRRMVFASAAITAADDGKCHEALESLLTAMHAAGFEYGWQRAQAETTGDVGKEFAHAMDSLADYFAPVGAAQAAFTEHCVIPTPDVQSVLNRTIKGPRQK